MGVSKYSRELLYFGVNTKWSLPKKDLEGTYVQHTPPERGKVSKQVHRARPDTDKDHFLFCETGMRHRTPTAHRPDRSCIQILPILADSALLTHTSGNCVQFPSLLPLHSEPPGPNVSHTKATFGCSFNMIKGQEENITKAALWAKLWLTHSVQLSSASLAHWEGHKPWQICPSVALKIHLQGQQLESAAALQAAVAQKMCPTPVQTEQEKDRCPPPPREAKPPSPLW